MLKKVLVILAISMLASAGYAKRSHRVVAQNQKVEEVKTQEEKAGAIKTWTQGKETVVKLKGQLAEGTINCQAFSVQVSKTLDFEIDCAGHSKSASISLENSAGLTVTKKGPHTTITKYNFLMKKPQVSRFQQSVLRVPYVEEIIHIKKSETGELSFYYESFRVDEFGRIVQDGFIQAHSLAQKKIKISAN